MVPETQENIRRAGISVWLKAELALPVAGAVFLIVDLDQPFEGLLQVSSAPLRNALTKIGP